MKLPIAEIFESIQFEGSQSGRIALFIRLAGCNMWNGIEDDRDKGKGNCAKYCDTDFTFKYSLTIDELKCIIYDYRDKCHSYPLVIFTGGEPTLHNNKLIDLFIDLLADDICVSLETNGTNNCSIVKLLVSHRFGHVTVSPKRENADKLAEYKYITVRESDDLKLIYPDNMDYDFMNHTANNFYIQIEAGEDNGSRYLDSAIQFLKQHSFFRLSVQTHKYLGLQ